MRLLATVIVGASLVLAPSVAEARQSLDLPYPIEQAWNATVRLVRVDLGFTITERDRETGFVLFTYRDTTRTSAASIEIIPADVGGVVGVRVVVQVPQMPTYMERHLLTRLDRKLHEDYGEPRRPQAREGDRPRDREPNRDRPREGEQAPSQEQRPREGEGAPAQPNARTRERDNGS
ncbi:MAG: hypothetical protein JNK05_19705 [Myxococcales bacterium]|nr:hypothetical protein [Myxococcales bacterium]